MTGIKRALPPVPQNRIDLADVKPTILAGWGPHPTGLAYQLDLDDGKDYLITSSVPVNHPIFSNGGRTVWFRGIHMDYRNFDEFKKPGTPGYPGTLPHRNVDPQIPGSGMFFIDNSGALVIEGSLIDGQKLTVDNLIPRNSALTHAQGRASRDIFIVNSLLVGGKQSSQVHADLVHWQGGRNNGYGGTFRDFITHNTTLMTGSQGITTAWEDSTITGTLGVSMKLSNTNFKFDESQPDVGTYMTMEVDSWSVSNTYIGDRPYRVMFLGPSLTTYWGYAWSYASGGKTVNVRQLEGTTAGDPPNGDFAKRQCVGLNY